MSRKYCIRYQLILYCRIEIRLPLKLVLSGPVTIKIKSVFQSAPSDHPILSVIGIVNLSVMMPRSPLRTPSVPVIVASCAAMVYC
jgi:hypothetical protein